MQSQKFNYEPLGYTCFGFDTADAKKALDLAKSKNRLIRITCNGIILNVTPHMTIGQIIDNYNKRLDYTTYQYMNSEKGMKKAREEKLAGVKRECKTEAILEYISGEVFETKPGYAWGWGALMAKSGMVTRFACNWARLMQKELKAGKALTRELIEKAGDDVNFSGITQNARRLAQEILISYWAHGEKMGCALGYDVKTIFSLRSSVKQANAASQHKFQMTQFCNQHKR